MVNFNQMTSNTLFMTQNTLFVTQNIIFVNQMAQNALFYSIYRHIGKIITYALGEHDPGSAQA